MDYQAARTTMVDRQVRPSDVTSYPIIEALLWAPRERFTPKSKRPVCYAGEHVEIAPGRVLLDPRVFAKMLDAAQVGPKDLVLDIACGLGYSSAVLARLSAAVVGVEADEDMARQAGEILAEIEVDNAVVQEGALEAGDPGHGPYDVIFVNGGVETIPQPLLDQLKDGGRLVAIHMDGALGQCRVTVRAGDALTLRRAFDATAPVLPGFQKTPEFTF
jgi:protein-L-isoaspartate(D-aspartate) O-methyltransferase